MDSESTTGLSSEACESLRDLVGRLRYCRTMLPADGANDEPREGIGVLAHLASGSVASVTRFRHHPRPFRDPAEEWFDGDEVILTTGGCWRIGGRRGWVDAGPGVVVLGHDGEPFRCDHGGTVPTDRNLAVRLKPGALGALLEPSPDPLSTMLAERPLPDVAALPLTPEVELTVRRLAAETEAWLPGRGLRLDCLVVELLIGLHRAAGSPASTPPAVRPRQREAIEAVRRHIDAHLGEDLDLATLAALGHTSPFHFSRLFRAVTGLPPHRYLRRARLERAEQLLAGGDATVTQVAHQVGFSSVSHFIAAFRRHTTLTPGQYRTMHRAMEEQRA
jgi:AraC family transcriptional regulator